MGKPEDSDEGLEEASGDDLMPQDGDEALGAGEEDFADEEWESYDEESARDEDAPPQKKKSSNFNKIVIAGAVVVGLGVAWMKVGGGGGSAPAPVAAPAAQQQVAAAPTQRDLIYGSTVEDRKKEEEARLEEPKGFLNNPDSLKKVEDLKNKVVFEGDEPIEREPDNSPDSEPHEVDYEPPMPAPMTPAGAEDGQGQQVPEQEQAQQEVLTPLPSDNLSAGLPAAEDIVRQPDNSADAEDESLVPAETGGGADFAGINEKLDDLAARLEGVESRLASLDGLERRIRTLETKPAVAPQPEKPAPAAELEPAPEPFRDRAVEDNPEETILTPAPVKSDPGPALQAAPSAAWVLKSARPGEALVAKKGGDGTLSVRTGDSLAGIGRITDIYSENNRWIVQGTSGRIVQ